MRRFYKDCLHNIVKTWKDVQSMYIGPPVFKTLIAKRKNKKIKQNPMQNIFNCVFFTS